MPNEPDNQPVTDVPIVRPNPLLWLWYAFAGRLPARYRGWVLHDLTCRTWWLRHLLRAVVQVSPIVALLLVFVPGTLVIRAVAVSAGVLLGLLYSGAYMHEIVEHRVIQAGFPRGTAARVREEGDAEGRSAQRERYERMWRSN
jgi:hypothetical protein